MPPYSNDVAFYWEKYINIKKGSDIVGYMEINQYQTATGDRLNPWEVDLMIDLDILRRTNG